MFIYDDDKEVPNTITTAYEYPNDGPHGKMLVFDTRPYYTNDEKGAKVGVLFYGSEGYMVIDSYSHYQVYWQTESKQAEEKGPGRNEGGDHYKNFVDAVRAQDPSAVNASRSRLYRSSPAGRAPERSSGSSSTPLSRRCPTGR